MRSVLNCHNVAKYTSFTWDSHGSMWLPMVMQGASKKALQWYSKRYCVASVTKTVTLKGVQAMDSSYSFKCNSFRNTRHTVFGVSL
jgi:hypothetical protein